MPRKKKQVLRSPTRSNALRLFVPQGSIGEQDELCHAGRTLPDFAAGHTEKIDAWSSVASVSEFQNGICATWAATSGPLGLIGAWN